MEAAMQEFYPSQQKGSVHLRGTRTKVWTGRWREEVFAEDGSMYTVRRNTVLGTLDELPTKLDAMNALWPHVKHATIRRKNRKNPNLWVPKVKPSAQRQRSMVSDAHYRSTYGLSLEEVKALSASQGGRCAICGDIPKRALVVDHCHKSQRRRALLCGHCNAGLGFFRDRPDVLRAAADYIELHNHNQ